MTKNGNLVCEGGCPSQKTHEGYDSDGREVSEDSRTEYAWGYLCQALESMYGKAADEAEAMVRAHRDLIGR
jgi:hypothetical protein